MHLLKLIFQKFTGFLRRTARLPRSISTALGRRRLQIGVDAAEAERLDRIREPWKYRGK